MLTTIPEKIYNMKMKNSIIKHNAKIYQKSSKKMKSQILDELSSILHMNRKYLSYLLKISGKFFYAKNNIIFISDPSINRLSKRGRKKVYTKEIYFL